MKIKLYLRKSVEENAGLYFDKAKKAKKKLSGVNRALEQSKEKLKHLNEKVEAQDTKKKEKRKVEWFEKFRWFFTSEGFMVIGGRDATTNEIVVKKHTDKGDLVFHTDMSGSPFFVIKAEGKEIPEKSISEAASAVMTFSRAWRAGFSRVEAFYVSPEQLSKEAPSGEFVGKGSFIVNGKANYVDGKIDCCLGMKDGMVMAAPMDAVSAYTNKFVVLEQSDSNTKASEIAKKVQKHIGGEVDEIVRVLPPGNSKIAKFEG